MVTKKGQNNEITGITNACDESRFDLFIFNSFLTVAWLME